MPDKFYAEIFAQNGASYHRAMQTYPRARDNEFKAALSFLNLPNGAHVLDVPAGGGYLKRYLNESMHYHGYDFSGGFDTTHNLVTNCSETKIDLPGASIDCVICLASLHHIEQRDGFYNEVYRLLKPAGVLLIGDVAVGSPQDTFLNKFVDQWNKLGHKGIFIDSERDQAQIQRAGFITEYAKKEFQWTFASANDAQRYFRLLFALDLEPSNIELTEAIKQLGIKKTSSDFYVGWSLDFIKSTKK